MIIADALELAEVRESVEEFIVNSPGKTIIDFILRYCIDEQLLSRFEADRNKYSYIALVEASAQYQMTNYLTRQYRY